jgi:hypothetical protein
MNDGGASPRVRLALWLATLGAGLALFHSVGAGPLAAPPLDPRTWTGWVASRDALVATAALLRLLVLALSWYLVGATGIGLIARAARSVRAVRVADAVTIPALRRLLEAGVGLSLATGVVVSALPTHVAFADEPPAVVTSGFTPGLAAPGAQGPGSPAARRDAEVPLPLRLVEAQWGVGDAGSAAERWHDPPPAPPALRRLDVPEEVVLRHLGPDDAVAERPAGPAARATEGGPDPVASSRHSSEVEPGTPAPAASVPDVWTPPGHARRVPAGTTVTAEGTVAATAGRPGGRPLGGAAPSNRPDEHVVVAGESLWTIARDVVTAAIGRAPTDAEIADYWLDLIEVQRPFLADPDDPDLIFPGERVRLPATEGRWSG